LKYIFVKINQKSVNAIKMFHCEKKVPERKLSIRNVVYYWSLKE
jgi:hypothetical protein